MTHSTASCLKRGDVVLHLRYGGFASVERVEPRKDAPGFWVVLQELVIPMTPGSVIGEPPKDYWVAPEDLQVVVARRDG